MQINELMKNNAITFIVIEVIFPDSSVFRQRRYLIHKVHLKLADLQTYIWIQCMQNIMEDPDIIDRGWEGAMEVFHRLWFKYLRLSDIV